MKKKKPTTGFLFPSSSPPSFSAFPTNIAEVWKRWHPGVSPLHGRGKMLRYGSDKN